MIFKKFNNIRALKFSATALFLLLNGAQAAPQQAAVALLPTAKEAQLTPQKALAAAQQQNTQAAATPVNDNWEGYNVAESLAVNGNPQMALKQLETRLNSVPDDGKAAYLKGMILMQLGDSERAESWFRMMQSNFPEMAQPYNALAVIYASRHDDIAAQKVLLELLQKQPNHLSARVNLAKIYLDLAEEELQLALKIEPDNAIIASTLQAIKSLRQQ